MQPQTDGDYKKLFTEIIKRQILILGPDITLAKVKNVPGIQVDGQGIVTGIEGNPQQLLQQLINQFVELSGMIVKKTMESILSSYPGLATLTAAEAQPILNNFQPQAPTVSVPQQPQEISQPQSQAQVNPIQAPQDSLSEVQQNDLNKINTMFQAEEPK